MQVKRRVTLNDVARRAGVSYQTVSRVIHEHPYVADETRQAVLQAIRDLGYRPNQTARSLVTNRSLTLGVVTYGKTYYGPGQMLAHIERTAKLNNYNLTFSSIDSVTSDELRQAVDNLCDYLVDGLIIIAPLIGLTEDELLMLCNSTPFVMVDSPPNPVVSSVSIDQSLGARLATQHLIDLGHTHLCEISGPMNWYDGRARHSGWVDTLRAAGLVPQMSTAGDWTAASGYAAARTILDSKVDFSALIVANDQMALGALRALRQRGLSVPEDVSLVGFDDIPEAAFYDPPLTTVRQDFALLGMRSVETLIQHIENPDAPVESIVISPELILRSSTRRIGSA